MLSDEKWKRTIAVVHIFAVTFSPSFEMANPMDARFLRALRIVESSDNDNIGKVWDQGSWSIGPYQIKEVYWQDAGRPGGDYETCANNRQLSEQCIRNYMERYATPQRLGRQPTYEDFARIHNGGPNGHTAGYTLDYWHKVQQNM